MTFSPSNSLTAFLPTYQYFTPDQEQFLITMTNLYSLIANSINIRQIGIYSVVESLTGQQFSNPTNANVTKFTYRTIFYFGVINAGATLSFVHNLTFTELTHAYGTCITTVIDYRPIPYASGTVVTNQIELQVTPTNIVIINGATAPDISSGIIVLEYLKN
jgi:hypothetical protein